MFSKTHKDALKACRILVKVVEKVKFLARCLTMITTLHSSLHNLPVSEGCCHGMGLEIQNLDLKVLNHGLGCGSGVFSGGGSNKPVVRKVRITVKKFRRNPVKNDNLQVEIKRHCGKKLNLIRDSKTRESQKSTCKIVWDWINFHCHSRWRPRRSL